MTGIIDNLSTSQQLELIYIGYFNRSADGGGLTFWAGQNVTAQNGGQSADTTLTNIANSFAPQPETIALYPFLGAPHSNPLDPAVQAGFSTLLDSIYANLFGRAPDAGGKSYWLGQLTSGAVGLGAAILAIANGATGADAIELQNKITVALDFTNRTAAAGLGVSSVPSGFKPAATAVLSGVDGSGLGDLSVTNGINATTAYITTATAPPLVLTLQTDTLTTAAAGAVFSAPVAFNAATASQVQTLQTGDSLTDSAGDGTLTATFNTGALVSGFTMSGVKTANLTAITGGGADGFSGTVTGLQVVNNTNSTNLIVLGSTTSGLTTALTTYNSTNNSGIGFAAFIAPAALAGASDAIAIKLTGAHGTGNTAGAAAATVSGLIFAPASGTNGYETWTITSNAAAFLYLGQGQGSTILGSGLGSGAHIVLNGAGSVELIAGIAGDWANLKTVDATAETGAVTLTGAAANVAGGYGSAAGTVLAGLLTSGGSTIAPTSIKGSATAANLIDLSGLTLANTDAIATLTGNTASGVTNTLILNNTVAEQAGTLAGESGFQVIGDSTLTAGTINMANFAGATEFKLFGTSVAGAGLVTITGAPASFVLDLSGDVGTGTGASFAVNGPSGTTDAFHLILGSTTHLAGGGGGLNSVADGFDTFTVKGYEAVTVTNASGDDDFVGDMSVTPSAGGGAAITLGGTSLLSVSSITLGLGGGSITDTVTGAQLWFGTTNAAVINEASNAGGLEMFAQGAIGNSGNAGIAINAHSGAGTVNNLIGSPGADAITGSGGTDIIVTNGGTNPTAGATFADVVTLGAGHTADHVEIYGFGDDGNAFATADNTYGALASSITGAGDLAQPGFWGVGAGAAPVRYGGLAANTGTSASQVEINNFVPGAAAGHDVVDISVGAWNNHTTPTFFGLYDSDLLTPPVINSPANISAPVGSGGTVTDSGGLLNPTNVVLLQGQFANANQLAIALHSTNPIKLLTALGAGNDAHVLFLYNDGTNNAHLADVDFLASGGSQSNTSLLTEHVSDMAVFIGVSATALAGADIHFIA